MKKKIKKCKHEWYYSNTVSFIYKNSGTGHYRTIHHCRKCGELDIQTIYS